MNNTKEIKLTKGKTAIVDAAAQAYNFAAIKHFGEMAKINIAAGVKYVD